LRCWWGGGCWVVVREHGGGVKNKMRMNSVDLIVVLRSLLSFEKENISSKKRMDVV